MVGLIDNSVDYLLVVVGHCSLLVHLGSFPDERDRRSVYHTVTLTMVVVEQVSIWCGGAAHATLGC